MLLWKQYQKNAPVTPAFGSRVLVVGLNHGSHYKRDSLIEFLAPTASYITNLKLTRSA